MCRSNTGGNTNLKIKAMTKKEPLRLMYSIADGLMWVYWCFELQAWHNPATAESYEENALKPFTKDEAASTIFFKDKRKRLVFQVSYDGGIYGDSRLWVWELDTYQKRVQLDPNKAKYKHVHRHFTEIKKEVLKLTDLKKPARE